MNLKHGRFVIQVIVSGAVLVIGALMVFLYSDESLRTTGVGFIGSVFTLWFNVKTSSGAKKKSSNTLEKSGESKETNRKTKSNRLKMEDGKLKIDKSNTNELKEVKVEL